MVQMVKNDALGLANELRPVLLRVARHVQRETAELGVTPGQATLLALIGGHPGITATDLAERERISAPGMSAHLDRLEAADLIVRTRGTDRRRVELTLSPEGKRMLKAVRAKRSAWLAERLEGLDDDERAIIEAAIEPLARLIEDA
jgi:DNA-binding MarR family transcriptional regulator